MSSSHAPYLPRRSARLGPKYWSAHFAKVGHDYNKTGMIGFLEMYMTRCEEPFRKNRPYKKGVIDNISKKCYYMNSIYESLLAHPQFLLDYMSFCETSYKKAQDLLTDEYVQKSKNPWAVKLKQTLSDYFQMMEYLHLCK